MSRPKSLSVTVLGCESMSVDGGECEGAGIEVDIDGCKEGMVAIGDGC